MPIFDGQFLTINLTLTIWGVPIKVEGTVEILAIRRETDNLAIKPESNG